MQRLIDATPAEEKLGNLVKSWTGRSMAASGYAWALDELRAQPTVDAVPVTRCKDCKHWGPRLPEDDSKGICWAFGAQPAAVTGADDYCSRAERRPTP